MSTISTRIKSLREEKQMSQADLAEAMQVNRMTINNYENGKRVPDIDFAMNCADYFGVSVEYLTGRTEFRNNQDFGKTIEKLQYLADIVQQLPTEEGRQMTNAFASLLEIAKNAEVSEPLMPCLTNLYTQLAQLILSHRDLQQNMEQSAAALKESGVEPDLIDAVLKEKPMSLFGHGMIVGSNATSFIQMFTDELVKSYTS